MTCHEVTFNVRYNCNVGLLWTFRVSSRISWSFRLTRIRGKGGSSCGSTVVQPITYQVCVLLHTSTRQSEFTLHSFCITPPAKSSKLHVVSFLPSPFPTQTVTRKMHRDTSSTAPYRLNKLLSCFCTYSGLSSRFNSSQEANERIIHYQRGSRKRLDTRLYQICLFWTCLRR